MKAISGVTSRPIILRAKKGVGSGGVLGMTVWCEVEVVPTPWPSDVLGREVSA